MENRLDGFDRSKSGSLKKSHQIYISWEMTPTSIGGENVLMITLRFFHWLSIHQVQNA